MKCTALVEWSKLPNEIFVDGKYSRAHQWKFDGGLQVDASSSIHIIPIPMSNPSFVDPEEAFVASLASCHLLFFLSYCSKNKYVVTHYEDNAEGILDNGPNGKKQMTIVRLHPQVKFEGDLVPSKQMIEELHELAHESCFIANSVKTIVLVEPLSGSEKTSIQQ